MENIVTIYKKINISSAHKLDLDYDSKCNSLHGHNYGVEIWIKGPLDKNGMVIDFNHVKAEVMKLDHVYLNDFFTPTTAEYIAVYLVDKVFSLSESFTHVKIRIWETETAYAEFEKSRLIHES